MLMLQPITVRGKETVLAFSQSQLGLGLGLLGLDVLSVESDSLPTD